MTLTQVNEKTVTLADVAEALVPAMSMCPTCHVEDLPERRKGVWVHERPDADADDNPADDYEECDVAVLHEALYKLGFRYPGGPA